MRSASGDEGQEDESEVSRVERGREESEGLNRGLSEKKRRGL